MNNVYIACGLLLLVAACEVPKTPVPTGGSKSDALVEMSYNVGGYERYGKTVVDWEQAQKSAEKRCAAWGYSKADPFEGLKKICSARSGDGNCAQTTVTRTYQCTN